MANDDPKALSAAQLRELANEADARDSGDKLAPAEVKELASQPVMLSASDLKELLGLQARFDALQKQLQEQGKIPVGIGDSACMCKACHPDNVIEPGKDGYKEVKDAQTGDLLPYMAAGTHAA